MAHYAFLNDNNVVTPFRGTFAQPGYTYDPDADEFVPPPVTEEPTPE